MAFQNVMAMTTMEPIDSQTFSPSDESEAERIAARDGEVLNDLESTVIGDFFDAAGGGSFVR